MNQITKFCHLCQLKKHFLYELNLCRINTYDLNIKWRAKHVRRKFYMILDAKNKTFVSVSKIQKFFHAHFHNVWDDITWNFLCQRYLKKSFHLKLTQ